MAIGSAAAIALAHRGAAVALAARRKDRLETLADQIRDQGGTALVSGQTSQMSARTKEAVERAVSDLGRLDILINNAGVMLLGPASDVPSRSGRRMVELNVLGLLSCAHAALPHLIIAATRTAPGGGHGQHQLGGRPRRP